MMRQVGDLCLSFLPFGDVLRSRDPTAALHGLFDHAKRMRARHLHDSGAEFALVRLGEHVLEKLLWVAGKLSRRFSALEQVKQGSTLEPCSRQTHHLGVTLVEQTDIAFRVEHTKPLRHVLKGRVKQEFLLPQLPF